MTAKEVRKKLKEENTYVTFTNKSGKSRTVTYYNMYVIEYDWPERNPFEKHKQIRFSTFMRWLKK